MRGLVLAGGRGTRLRPITHSIAKQLIPVAGREVLFYGLEALAGAGITDTVIVVGDREAQIRAAVGDGSAFGLSVTYVRQPAPLGLAHAVLTAGPLLGGEPFVMYLGDNVILDEGVTELVQRFRADPVDAEVLLAKVDDPGAYGVAEIRPDGALLGVAEKPADPRSDLALIGAYAFGPAVHEAVRAIRPSARGELEITDTVQWMIEHGGEVRAHVFEGYWRDTGSVADLLHCHMWMMDGLQTRIEGNVDPDTELIGPVQVGKNTVVSGSRLVGPVIIGSESTVTGARLGPYTSIGPRCLVEGAWLECAVVLPAETVVERRRIASAVIGRGEVLPGLAGAMPIMS